jgi:hypothetical protein
MWYFHSRICQLYSSDLTPGYSKGRRLFHLDITLESGSIPKTSTDCNTDKIAIVRPDTNSALIVLTRIVSKLHTSKTALIHPSFSGLFVT